jgi:hypothetical protein
VTWTGRTRRLLAASLIVCATAYPSVAQTPATTQTPSGDAIQIVPLQESTGQSFLVFGRPFMNTELLTMLRDHTSKSDWRTSDNTLVPRTFIYDPLHKRLIGPGIQLGDFNNPANLRLGRVITDANDAPDFQARHKPGTIVGQICSMGWGRKGFTACQAAVQFITFDENTGGFCISLETGKDGSTPPYPGWPTGIPFAGQDLVCHVLVYPDGTVVVGVNTDPNQRPKFSLIVNGDGEFNGRVVINGDLTVTGTIRAGNIVPTVNSRGAK